MKIEIEMPDSVVAISLTFTTWNNDAEKQLGMGISLINPRDEKIHLLNDGTVIKIKEKGET